MSNNENLLTYILINIYCKKKALLNVYTDTE